MEKMPMPPAQGAEGEAPAQAPGGASKLVSDIHGGMMQLMDLMAQSDAIEDADKQEMASVIQHFQSVVEGLGSAPGPKAPPAAPKGVAAPEAGAADVRPAL